ncbi:hypothetical protein [Flavobacterium praedii]|uniref:hypothetical protein n=1 Tax=Flavobacterium praedii TaxID=3002900 RepID=UPI002481D271|nr:hypothetical protein [Flavobacterium praedii]
MKKIHIHPVLKKQLEKEFSTSYQTVTMSLDGVFTSEKAKAIRKRAVELLEKEIDKLKESEEN